MGKDFTMMSFIKLNSDEVLFTSLMGIILLAALWPLGLLAYLLSVFGSRILIP